MYNKNTSKERFDRRIFPAENLWAKELSNMNLVISGKNIDITEGLRSAVEEKIGKLERYFTDSTEVHVTLSTEKTVRKSKLRYR